MGNNSNPITGLQPRYEQLGIYQNELLSTLLIVKDNETQQRLFVKQINIASDLQYLKLTKEFKQRKATSDKKIAKYIVKLREFQNKETSQICGKCFKLLLYIQYLPNSLKTIFQQRVRSQNHFQQDQLLKLVSAVVNGLIIMHDNNIKNVYLQKEAIVLTCQNTYKLLDTQLCNRIHPYFEIINGVPPKNGTYLAPQLLADIRKEGGDFYNSSKADLFSLGVLLLELATLENCDRFYDYESKTVDVNGLRQLTNKIKVSQHFKQLILCLLQEEQQDRIGLLSLRQKVSNKVQTLPNEDNFARQSSLMSHAIKQTARTGISTRKRINSVQNTTPKSIKQNNQRFIQPPRYRQISEYITNIQKRQNAYNMSQVTKRSYQSMQPVYAPIETQHKLTQPKIPTRFQIKQPVSQLPRITISNSQLPPSVRCTPRAQSLNNNLPQLDTLVNLLIQHQYSPQVTALPKVEEVKIAQNNYKVQLDTQLSQPQTPVTKTDIFKNKSYGKLDFSNGALYQGEFNQEGEFDGNGMLYYPNGKVCYSGSWKNNSFHGFGALHNQSFHESEEQTEYWNFNLTTSKWNYYQGQFNMDHKQGFGTLYLMNGDKFSGCFKNDLIESFGTFFIAKSQKYINGIWVNNILKQ